MHSKPFDLIQRFRRLERRQQLLLIDAVATLAAVSVALRLLPFKRAIRLGSAALGTRSNVSADDCVWAIEAVARRLTWRTVCIQKGIAAQRMLRRHGIDATLHYGLAGQRPSGKLEAHVWVTVNGSPVVGGAEAAEFAPVAAYP